MGRNALNGFRCVNDYYDNLVTGKSASDFYREQEDQAKERARDQERTYQEMKNFRDLYGD